MNTQTKAAALAVTLTSIWTAWNDGQEDTLDDALRLACLAVRDLNLHEVDGVLASPLNYFVGAYLDESNPEDLTYCEMMDSISLGVSLLNKSAAA